MVELELPLEFRVMMVVLPGAITLIGVATIFLYLRTRAKPVLVMTVAVLLGWAGQAIIHFSPRETVVDPPALEAPGATAPGGLVSGAHSRSVGFVPAFWLSTTGVVLWVGGFVAYSLSAARRQ